MKIDGWRNKCIYKNNHLRLWFSKKKKLKCIFVWKISWLLSYARSVLIFRQWNWHEAVNNLKSNVKQFILFFSSSKQIVCCWVWFVFFLLHFYWKHREWDSHHWRTCWLDNKCISIHAMFESFHVPMFNDNFKIKKMSLDLRLRVSILCIEYIFIIKLNSIGIQCFASSQCY